MPSVHKAEPHDHAHAHGSELSETELRVRALETILTEKGYVEPAALDRLIETYETKVGPRNGARVVARAWSDGAYRVRLLEDATPAIGELGFAGRQGEHLIAVENTPGLHNMVVCTLCSCYPWPVLGLPPFHAEWERRAFALTLAMSMPGGWNIDMSRFAREDRPPAEYRSKSYYQIWLAGLERLMLERKLVAEDEIAAGKSLHPVKPVTR